MFKFIHAADIHLDSPLVGLAKYDGAPVERLRGATRRAFENLVQFALDERVAFVVIAGDLYDGDWKNFNTGIYLTNQLGRLTAAGIRVVLLYGNHDAESQLTKGLPLGAVQVFPSRAAATIRFDDLGVALHGRSFKDRDTTENLVPGYPAPVAGVLNIGVLHTALTGNAPHAPYAPCSLIELVNKGYDYWALGHVHAAQVLSRSPWVVFPGNLQGRHVKETGPKGAMLVTVEEQSITRVEPIHVDVLRWLQLEVDATGAATRAVVEERVRVALEAAVREHADGRPVAARVTIRGACGAHRELVAHDDQLRADLRAIAAGMGADVAWIEKIRLETKDETEEKLQRDGDTGRGALFEQLRQLLDEAPTDPELQQQLLEDLTELLGKVPSDARGEFKDGLSGWIRDGRLDEVVRVTTPVLLARLDGRRG